MAKRLIVLASLWMLLLPSVARGEVYFAFSAEQMEYQGQQRIFFVPFSFTAPTHKQFERRIAVLFEKLHGSRQAVYGDTYLAVKEADGKYTATLHLDPGVVRFHEVILGEIYLTLANVGITDVHLGAGGKLLTDTDVKYPYFVPTIPLWEALPPAHFPHALIRLGVDQYVESNTYYEKLKARDAALYARMTDLLKSDEPYVKLRILGAFPLLQVPGEEAHLLPLLADKDLGVRYKAIELLKEKTDPTVLNALASLADGTDDPETQLQAARILVKNGRNNYAIYILFEELKAADTAVVVKTVQKLAASGDKRVLTALVRQLTHASPDVRQAAFAGLKQMRDLPNLKSLLSNKDISEDFRKETAAELMRQQDAAFAVEGIKYLVKVHSGDLAVEAITTVEMRGYKDQAELLVSALDHTDEQVALAAINAVGKLELIDLLPALSKAAVKRGLTSSCRSCITSLLETQGLKTLMKKARSDDMLVRELAVLSLVKQAKARAAEQKDIEPILELLGESMKDKEVVIKRAAVQALHEIGGKRNWKRLLRMKKDPDAGIRMLVGQAALSLADENGDTVILELLADEDDKVRLEAIKSIRERKIKSARGKLKFMVGGRDKAQKTEAMRTIVALNESVEEHKEFFEIYKKLIFEMDAEIQLAAINGIQWIIDPMVVPLLQSGILIMHKDPRVRAATLIALGRSRDHNVVEHIARGFADGELTVQAAAVEGLRLMGHKKGVTPLQEYIKQSDDEDLIQKAREAIDEIQTKPKGLLD
jgi:HEAT repeat protein